MPLSRLEPTVYETDFPKKRFLVVAPFFPRAENDPLIGGAVGNPAHLWARVAEEGHAVTVVTYGRPLGAWSYRRVNVLSLGPLRFKGVMRNLLLEAKVFHAIWRLELFKGVEQIRIHQAGGLGLVALRRLGFIKAPLVLAGSSPWGTKAGVGFSKGSFGAMLGRWIRSVMDKALYKGADLVVLPSHALLKPVMSAYGIASGKIVVVPNGYDETRFCRCDKAAAQVRQNLGVSGQESIILTVIREGAEKEKESFAETARFFESQAGGIPLRFVCILKSLLPRKAGHEGDELGGRPLPKNLLFVRNVQEADLPGFYAAARVCVILFSGLERAIPSTFYEACACGCTVLAGKFPGIEDLIEGPFLDSQAPEALARCLNDVFNQDLRTTLLQDYSLGALAPVHAAVGTGRR